jgi:hypothetical protein
MPDEAGHGPQQAREPWIDSQDLADLTADTASRLARPDLFLITVLRRYWNEATAEEARSVWQGTVRSHPSYAIDVLNGLYQITQDPPENLVTLIVDQARVIFYKDTPQGRKPYDAEDYVAWLNEVYADWYGIFAAAHPEVSAGPDPG